MSTHLDVETLERALHGELDPGPQTTVERHLAMCDVCAGRLAEARRDERDLLGLLETIDHEPPAIDWRAVTHEARPGATARSLIAASLAFLVVVAGILYAMPGSPLRTFVASVSRDAPEPAAPDPTERAVSGIAVEPADPFEVAFAAPQRTGRIRVTIVPSSRLDLRVLGAPVELESGPDRLLISNQGSTSGYELLVPQALRSLRVTVAGQTVFDRRGDEVSVPRSPDPSGAYLIDLREPET